MKNRIFFSLIVISLLYSNNITIEPIDFYQNGQIKKAKHPIKIKEEMDLILSTIKMIKHQNKVNLRMAFELENGLSIVKKGG